MAKEGIHPTYYHDTLVTCSCGHTFVTGSTLQRIKTDICSNCHPFYTGEQRIVDTAGRVDRFKARLQAAQQFAGAKKKKKRKRKERGGISLIDIMEE